MATPVPVQLDSFPFASFRASRGDLLALLIRAPRRKWQRSYQGGGAPADETISDAVTGTVRLLQGSANPRLPRQPDRGADAAAGKAIAARRRNLAGVEITPPRRETAPGSGEHIAT